MLKLDQAPGWYVEHASVNCDELSLLIREVGEGLVTAR